MRYISTRGQAPALNFEDVLLAGLASDGGLYVPENLPRFTQEEIASWAGLPYHELAFRVMHDTSVSNFNVVRFLLFPRLRRHSAEFVHIPLELRDPNGLAVLAMIVCITPGTAWAEISRDRSMLLIHALEVEDAQQVIDHIKQSYERPLMEIFE